MVEDSYRSIMELLILSFCPFHLASRNQCIASATICHAPPAAAFLQRLVGVPNAWRLARACVPRARAARAWGCRGRSAVGGPRMECAFEAPLTRPCEDRSERNERSASRPEVLCRRTALINVPIARGLARARARAAG
jgi:hypothetical protein